LLDAIALYDRLQDPYRDYAERTGHAVLELHAYAIDAARDRGPRENAAWLMSELRQALPELAEARVLHQEVMQQSNFSGFPPGSFAQRPTTTTAYRNLFLAGDWVRLDLPVALMEAAVTSGRLAANAILEKHGVASAAVASVTPRGVLA
jgi:isorenieratene synthase